MGWINLVASRPKLRTILQNLTAYLREEGDEAYLGATPPLMALLTGSTDQFKEAVGLSRAHYQLLAGAKAPLSDEDFLTLANLSIAFHLVGEDQTELWKKIADWKFPKHPLAATMTTILRQILGVEQRPQAPSSGNEGWPAGSSELLALAKKGRLRQAFDAVTAPDSEVWQDYSSELVLPLGLLLSLEKGPTGESHDPFDLYYLGAHPERHSQVVYERSWPRPQWDAVPEKGKPETWFGFDAVELVDNKALVYHYLTLNWQAPLLFSDDLNAFAFLDQLQNSWQFVQDKVETKTWQVLESLREKNQCEHVVVTDTNQAPDIPEHLERAAAHYNLRLIVKDLTQV